MLNILKESKITPTVLLRIREGVMVTEGKILLARNLKRIRVARGLRQKELAAMIGVTESQISLYENESNSTGISLDNLGLLANALGVQIEALFVTNPTTPLPAYTPPPPPKPEITLTDALRFLNSLGGPYVLKKRKTKRPKSAS